MEISDGSAFEMAARFCGCEATVVIRCMETGQEVHVHCCPRDIGYAADHFRMQWVKKHGPVL